MARLGTTTTTSSKWDLLLLALAAAMAFVGKCDAGTPAPAQFYNFQLVDHLRSRPDNNKTSTSNSNSTYWSQRYYTLEQHFQGPGSPIFVILGGEGAIEPSTGLMYPFVTNVLAKHFGAYVLQPEHRFYGASQPLSAAEISQANPDPRIQLLTYEQALMDAMRLIQRTRDQLGCSPDRSMTEITYQQQTQSMYCPVITVGGSYPGFLSAMARIMFPNIVDMAYAASAPMLFYAQRVPQIAYYQHITRVAETAVPGCARAVQKSLMDVQSAFRKGELQRTDIGACPDSIPYYCNGVPAENKGIELFLEETFMMVGYSFANDNMAFYPPLPSSRLHQACEIFLDRSRSPIERLRDFLLRSLAFSATANTGITNAFDHAFDFDHYVDTRRLSVVKEEEPTACFSMKNQLPTGPNATITGGDWSGIGKGQSGESWDFQTCTLCVEAIGFDSITSMFPDRHWSVDWLARHCRARFHGVTPQPYSLRDRWHIDDLANKSNATYILFTNGLNDGWSVSGIQQNLSDTLLALNFPNGAHHSDLSGKGPTSEDTADVAQGFVDVQNILALWLDQQRERRSIQQ